jgi:two-component system sensor histidine kinase HupT/HoxJ
VVELELLRRPGPARAGGRQLHPACLDAAGRRVGTSSWAGPWAELKRAYHQLREAHEALKRTQQQLLHSEKMASLGRLVAGVAHELNNPISFVLGNVHALQRYSERLQAYLGASARWQRAAGAAGRCVGNCALTTCWPTCLR